jgi:hypothetical protein
MFLVSFLMSVLAFALSVSAQMGIGPRLSDLSGIWNPSVGSGAVYDGVTANGQKIQVEITIIGKEDVNGKTGYWMEIAGADPRSGGDIFLKYLVSPGDTGMVATRMIMQLPGQGPMEMDQTMMNRGGRGLAASPTPADIRSKAEVVGTESVTVPGGTFSCQHYRAKDGSGGDYWISDKVGPWGLVKMQEKKGSSDSTVVLTRIVSDAKEHITGTPTKFDPMQMMRRGPQGQ